MLCDLRDKLISENRLFTPYYIWNNYKILDVDGNVEQLDTKQNVNALTHLFNLFDMLSEKIQLFRACIQDALSASTYIAVKCSGL